jgi:hypothetical protein
VLLGENHSESHFNLALVYERRGLLDNAERETLGVAAVESSAAGHTQPAGCDLRPGGKDCPIRRRPRASELRVTVGC